MILALDDLESFRSSDFQIGLLVGACALAVTALGLGRRSFSGRWLGAVLPAAWTVALAIAVDAPAQLIAGLVCLFATGVLHDTSVVPLPAAVALASVGAWITSTAVDGPELSAPAIFVLIFAVGLAVVAFAVCERSAMVILPIVTITLGGFYATLPDTEWVVPAIGVLLPLLLLAQPHVPLRLGAAGAFTMSGLLAATIAVSWGGRETAIVGAYGSLGLVIVAPLAVFADAGARAFWVERHRLGRLPWFPTVLVAHAALVLVCSRGAGLRSSVAAALVIAVAALGAAAAGMVAVGRRGVTSTNAL